jgi:hypothetical protein
VERIFPSRPDCWSTLPNSDSMINNLTLPPRRTRRVLDLDILFARIPHCLNQIPTTLRPDCFLDSMKP